MARTSRATRGVRHAEPTGPCILAGLRNAFVAEVQRQYDAGALPGHYATLDGFMVPADAERSDIFTVFDTELCLTPILAALLKELRKLPHGEIAGAIDGALRAASDA